MPDRQCLARMLYLAPLLALAMSVQVLALAAVSCHPDGAPHDLELRPGQPTTRIVAAIADDEVLHVNALSPENEEEEQDRADALDDSRVSFLIPCSFRKVSVRHSIASRSILSLYPLRC